MVEFIEEAVQDIRDDPNSGNSVELILGVDPSHKEEVTENLRSQGVDDIEVGEPPVILVTVDEAAVAEITRLPHLEDIELNSTGKVLSQGNGNSHPATIPQESF